MKMKKKILYILIIIASILKVNMVVNADSYCKATSRSACKERPYSDSDLLCEWYEKDGKGECRVKCSNYSKRSCNGYTVCKLNSKDVCEYVGAGNGNTPSTNIKACNKRTKKSECEDGTGGCVWNKKTGKCKESCYTITGETECKKDDTCEWDTSFSYSCHPSCESNTTESDCSQAYCKWNKKSKKCEKETSSSSSGNSSSGSLSRNENEDGTITDASDCSDGSGKKSVKFGDEELCYGENQGVYCSRNPGDKLDNCFILDKSQRLHDEYIGVYGFSIGEWEITNIFGATRGTTVGLLLTSENDSVANSYGLWWASLNLCYTWEPHVFSETKYSMFAYTDSLAAIKGAKSLFKDSDCRIYEPINVDSKNKISYCSKINSREDEILDLADKYKKNPSPTFINEYKILVSEIEELCKIVLKNNDFNDACISKCIKVSESIKDWDEEFDISVGETCGFSSRLIAWIMNIVKWIKYIIPVAVIVLGMLDFIKATGSDKDDDMKKAQGRFIKRLIAAALIFLIPLLIEFVLTKFGFDYNSCSLF